MRIRVIIAYLPLLLLVTSAFAQVETASYFMSSLPQYVNSNPAFVPRYKFSLGLPAISSVAVSYTNNGFAYADLIKKENNKLVADLSAWAKNLPDKTYIGMGMQTDLFRLGVRVDKKIYVTFNSTLKGYGRMLLPKQLASLLVNGTSPYIGQQISMSPEINLTSYLENALGASYQISDELRVGARVKVLNGIVAARTEKSQFGISLNDSYQITATGDFSLQSSGIYNIDQSDYDFAKERSNYFKNTGFALDLGATYKLMDNLTLAASLIDIGKIKWKNNVYRYSLDNASYTFKGIDVDQLLNGNSDYANAQLDSLEKEFKLQESQGTSFSSSLPGKMLLSGNYEVMKNFSVGALFHTEKYQGRIASGLSLMANKNFGRTISTSVSYSISNRSFNNLGAAVSFNLAPIQFYIASDNLIRMPLSLAANQNLNSFVNHTQVFNLRLGFNIVWGWTTEDGEDRKMKNATKKSKNSLKNSSQYKARKKK